MSYLRLGYSKKGGIFVVGMRCKKVALRVLRFVCLIGRTLEGSITLWMVLIFIFPKFHFVLEYCMGYDIYLTAPFNV
jgi:hypothetical protein